MTTSNGTNFNAEMRTHKALLDDFVACSAIAAFLLSVVALAQTSPEPPSKEKSVYAELAKAPQKAADRRNPLEADPDAVAAGGKLFAQHCAECHGDQAGGGKKGPSLLVPEVQQSTPGALFWLLTNGVVRRGMPVWSKLPEPQRWQLVSFIKSLPQPPRGLQNGEKASQP